MLFPIALCAEFQTVAAEKIADCQTKRSAPADFALDRDSYRLLRLMLAHFDACADSHILKLLNRNTACKLMNARAKISLLQYAVVIVD